MVNTSRYEYKEFVIVVYPISTTGFQRYSFHIMKGEQLIKTASKSDARPSKKAAKNVAVEYVNKM